MSVNMKTNPGPYYALPMGHEQAALVKRGRKIIAEVFTDRKEGDQYQTAALFAAAPAMLEALQSLADAVDQFVPLANEWPELSAARAAIAQAMEGQS
jgi:hypothetical protein